MRLVRALFAGALLALGLAAATPAAAPAATLLQPGAMMNTPEGQCTMNFVYDGGGKTYIGTAAHCVDHVGEAVEDGSGQVWGTVALIGDADTTVTDYAFVEVLPSQLGRVSPAMKGHPQFPTGVTTESETNEGDLVQLSGYGVGFGETKTTQEQRQAVMGFDDNEYYDVIAPLIFGDSGGPLVHIPTGKALGIVSRLCIGLCEEEGATVQGILAKAAARGFSVSLRTV